MAQPAGNLSAGHAAAAGVAAPAGTPVVYPAADLTSVHLVEKICSFISIFSSSFFSKF